MNLKKFCYFCGRHDLEMLAYKDKASDPDRDWICHTCIADQVADWNPEDFDKLSAEAFSLMQHLVMSKSLPEPTRKTIFFKIIASPRMKNMLKKDGINLKYNYGDDSVKVEKD